MREDFVKDKDPLAALASRRVIPKLELRISSL